MTTWVYTGEVSAKRLRERYLGAVMRQDIAFFDNVGAGEVATRIQTDTREFGRYHTYNLYLNDFRRLGPAGHFRESSNGRHVSVCFRHRLPPCIYPIMATCSGIVLYLAVHYCCRCKYEQGIVEI